jgi:hypothetical protein
MSGTIVCPADSDVRCGMITRDHRRLQSSGVHLHHGIVDLSARRVDKRDQAHEAKLFQREVRRVGAEHEVGGERGGV